MAAVEKICKPGEKLRAQKETHPALGTVGTNAIDDIGPSALERLQQCGIIGRIVLQVGILDDDVLAHGVPNAGANGGTLAAIPIVENDVYLRIVHQAKQRFA